MKKIPLFLFINILIVKCYSQSGTLILGTIIDGKVYISADSRSVYFENDSHTTPIAYFDSTKKIYKLKQFIIGMSGSLVIGNITYEQVITAFNKTKYSDTSLLNTVKKFREYIKNNFPNDTLFTKNTIIAGGFVNGKPQIIADNHVNTQVLKQEGELTSNTNRVFKYAEIFFGQYSSIVERFDSTYFHFARRENLIYKVGGPISIAVINQNNTITWLKNNFSDRVIKSTKELYSLIVKEKIKMVYLVDNGREKLLSVIKKD